MLKFETEDKPITGTVTISTKEYNFLRDFKNKISETGSIKLRTFRDRNIDLIETTVITKDEVIRILNKDFQIDKDLYNAKIKELEEEIEKLQIPLKAKIKELEEEIEEIQIPLKAKIKELEEEIEKLQSALSVNKRTFYTKGEIILFCHQLSEQLKNLSVKQFEQIGKGKIKFFTSEEENKY